MKRILLTAFLAIALLPLPCGLAQEAALPSNGGASILRVNITSQGWNFMLPWQKRSPNTRRGLGALLAGNRVLVTAELAQDATYIELEQASTGEKLTAKVEFVDYECNLATIVPTADPGKFFAANKPLEIDTEVKPKAKLDVWQFENNGTAVSTSIDLNRVDIGEYFLPGERFLTFEANGAVQYRGGTFTLPVMNGPKLAGMLLSYSSKDQSAQLLPGKIIARFLEDAVDGKYEGFPHFGVKIATTLDPQLRSFLKLDEKQGGLYVSSVVPGSSAEKGGVQKGDVILSIAGFSLDPRGNYVSPEYGLLSSGHLLKGAAKVGDVVKVSVWRDGAAKDLDIKMERKEPHSNLVDPYLFDRGPHYLILGGLLFQELTAPYLRGGEDRDSGPFRLLYAMNNPEEYEKQGRKKLVFLSGILPAESNQGYDRMSSLIVDKINGKFISEIKDVDEALKSPENGIHKIEFSDFPRVIYVDAAQAESDNKETMPGRYRINQLKRLE